MTKKQTNDQTENSEQADLTEQLSAALSQVAELKEMALRARADYQNLVRRQQDERAKLLKLAAAEVVEQLLEPLDHLQLAAAQIGDSGLNMVVQQFDRTMAEIGLTPVAAVGQPYNLATMEATDGSDPAGQAVTQIIRQGYTLNGELLRPARVLVK